MKSHKRCSASMNPPLRRAPYVQSIVSTLDADKKTGFAVLLDTQNNLVVWLGTSNGVETIKFASGFCEQRWFHTRLTVSGRDVQVDITHLPSDNEPSPSPTRFHSTLAGDPRLSSDAPLLFAASYASSPNTQSQLPIHFFNGRLDAPQIKALG